MTMNFMPFASSKTATMELSGTGIVGSNTLTMVELRVPAQNTASIFQCQIND
jgi:hypothetical protein